MHQYPSTHFIFRLMRSSLSIQCVWGRCSTITLALILLSLQIEQEMDLVLSKRDSFKQALQSWKEIWVPTLLEYGSHLHENIYDSAQKMFEGILVAHVKDCLLCVNPLDAEVVYMSPFTNQKLFIISLVWRSE